MHHSLWEEHHGLIMHHNEHYEPSHHNEHYEPQHHDIEHHGEYHTSYQQSTPHSGSSYVRPSVHHEVSSGHDCDNCSEHTCANIISVIVYLFLILFIFKLIHILSIF